MLKALPFPLAPPPSQPLWVPYSLLLNAFLIYKFMSSSFTALPFDLEGEEKKKLFCEFIKCFPFTKHQFYTSEALPFMTFEFSEMGFKCLFQELNLEHQFFSPLCIPATQS